MISILISSYNQDPSKLVKDLSAQINALDWQAEIIIGNDCSESKFMPIYKELENLQLVSVFTPDKNLGRSKIRNTLAGKAAYSYLLFIDGDAEVIDDNYIRKYLDSAAPGQVVCGGTAYQDTPPENQDKILRWKYGMKREARTASQRNQATYKSFSSFNFLIHADDFKVNSFDEAISKYGHEDTLFGIELRRKGIIVRHIENPLIHTGLDSAEVFLGKTAEGVQNLKYLENVFEDKESLYSHVRLLKKYQFLRKCGLRFLLSALKKTSFKGIQRNLIGSSPSIRLFDLYKLILINDIKN